MSEENRPEKRVKGMILCYDHHSALVEYVRPLQIPRQGKIETIYRMPFPRALVERYKEGNLVGIPVSEAGPHIREYLSNRAEYDALAILMTEQSSEEKDEENGELPQLRITDLKTALGGNKTPPEKTDKKD